jgi:prepilin-type N-terminal cleavage/methylation domain-containing protein
MKSSKGFTLIELMITIAILGTLTVLAANAISQAIKVKVKLQDQIDDVSKMRDGMRLMEKDINMAFHYRDVEKDMYDIIKKKNVNPNVPPPPPGLANPGINKLDPFATNREVPRKDPVTHFVGQSDAMSFVTSNNARTVKDTKQADFVEVGYSLKDCKNLSGEGATSKCLWRRSSPYVDDDVTKGGDETVLLENVTEFKLRYIGKGKQDWSDAWRTDDGGDATTKGRYPEAVEISLTVEKKDKGRSKKYSMQNIVPVHFPNNPDGGTSSATTPATPTGP